MVLVCWFWLGLLGVFFLRVNLRLACLCAVPDVFWVLLRVPFLVGCDVFVSCGCDASAVCLLCGFGCLV